MIVMLVLCLVAIGVALLIPADALNLDLVYKDF